ncbi:hypothetical protein EON81_20045 [bacterium]|nr:MAG: hypothetical protein EON81_20045 [bacterium]
MTVEEFIAGAGSREGELVLLDRMIREVAPDLLPFVSDRFLMYGAFRYRYASGREGDSARIIVAPRRAGITLHLACGNGSPVAGTNPGVGCLKIKDLARIDLDALRRELTRAATAHLPQEHPRERE